MTLNTVIKQETDSSIDERKEPIDINSLVPTDIFKDGILNEDLIKELRNNPDVDHSQLETILANQKRIQEKMDEYLKFKDTEKDLKDSDNGGGNETKPKQINYAHWTHHEATMFIQGVEECGKNNEAITKYLQQNGVKRDKRQVVSHAQKFFNKIKKNLDSSPDISQQKLQVFCMDKATDPYIEVNSNNPSPAAMLDQDSIALVLKRIMALDQVTMGRTKLAILEYCRSEEANVHKLAPEDVAYLIAKYARDHSE